MISDQFKEALAVFNPTYNTPLAPYTTWKIGGPAEALVVVSNSTELEHVLHTAVEHQVPYRVLGNGSNILISDNGIKDLVIINESRNIAFPTQEHAVSEEETTEFDIYIPHRHHESGDSEFYTFADLDYTEEGQRYTVTFDSGVDLSYAIAITIKNGFTGLQWFAGIPGSIGGSLYNNIHGGTKHFSDNFESAQVFDPATNTVRTLTYTDFQFGYDQSILRKNQDLIVLNVTLKLFKGDPEKARFTAQEWTKRKRVQPKISCGSVFQSLLPEDQQRLGFPTASAGYIIDKILGLRGYRLGNVQIAPNHANFIENVGENAKASDVLTIIKKIKKEAYDKCNVHLIPEINFLGFTTEELQGVLY